MALSRYSISKFGALFLTGLLVLSSMMAFGTADSRTGTNDNEPANGFSEGVERIEIYHLNGDHDTNFTIDETVYIRITTNLVTQVPGKDNDNRVRVRDYLNNPVGADHKPFFTEVDVGPPHVFEGSFVADAGNGFTVDDDYLLNINLREAGQNRMTLDELIHVGGASTPEEKYFKLFSDATYAQEVYGFAPTDTIYGEVWTGADLADNTSSDVSIASYQGLRVNKQVSALVNPALTQNGNYTRFAYDLSADPGVAFLIPNGYWFTLQTTMNDGATDLVRNWAVQFMINNTLANPPVVTQGDTTADPALITVGVDTTTLSTNFSHADTPSVNTFIITYKVKDPDGTEYTLVDQRINGQGGLTVTQDGVDLTLYTATFDWAPALNQPIGLYDLYFKVNDSVSLPAEDAYVNNEDELELVAPPAAPLIIASATTADPSEIGVIGPGTTVISVNFSHDDGPSADSFKITFKLRDQGNLVLPALVENAQSGSSGLLVTKTGNTTYVANVTWDPPDDTSIGTYDLFSRVEDGNGVSAEDGFGVNQEELNLVKDPGVPLIAAGATAASPNTINRTGSEVTIISTPFSHGDIPGVAIFTVTYKVKDENNVTYVLVDAKKAGLGGLTIQDLGSGDYKASYVWDPQNDQPIGKYDLYFFVQDALGKNATDSFSNNVDELTLTKKPAAPVLVAGVTGVDPDIVNIMGNATTTISTSFFHEDIPATSTFQISFKVRDVGNQEYILLNSASGGTSGLTVTSEGNGNFTAAYVWDPPSVNQPLGTYDLLAAVKDSLGNEVLDSYANNLDELTLEKEAVGPTNSTLSGKVTDIDGEAIANATVKVYDSVTGEVVKTLTTGSDGAYSVALPAGLYDVAVQATGFKGETIASKQLNEGTPLVLPDFKLIKLVDDTKPVVKKVTEEVIPGYIQALVGLLILIVIVMCLFILMKMSTGSVEPGGRDDKGGHHAHEKSSDDVSPDHPLEPKEAKELESEPKPIDPDKVEIEPIKED